MNSTLLNEFLEEECTVHVRTLIKNRFEAARSGAAPRTFRFEFNRFEISFDIDKGCVLIEDVLNSTESGEECVPITVFALALEDDPRWVSLD